MVYKSYLFTPLNYVTRYFTGALRMTSITLETLTSFDQTAVKEWFERFDALCLLTKVDGNSKVSALITYIGGSAYSVLAEHFSPKTVAEQTYEAIRDCLNQYKAVEVLIAVARYNFSKIVQESNEDVQTLLHRINAAAHFCKFNTASREIRIGDQLVVSLINRDQIQIVLQMKNDDYMKATAKDLMLKIQAMESIKRGMTVMGNDETSRFKHIDVIRKDNGKATALIKCTFCGRTHKRKECPVLERNVTFAKALVIFKLCAGRRCLTQRKTRSQGRNLMPDHIQRAIGSKLTRIVLKTNQKVNLYCLSLEKEKSQKHVQYPF